MAQPRDDMLDCVIVGAGPAGLTAALYLSRYGRRYALIDNGESRAAWIPESHNIPVFAHGIPGPEILNRQRAHAESYGAAVMPGVATKIAKQAEGFSVDYTSEKGESASLTARFVLLATGVSDIGPLLNGLEDAVKNGLIRFCPICDGYEAKGKKVAVIGIGDGGTGEALFLARTFTKDVTVLSYGKPFELPPSEAAKLNRLQVKQIVEPVLSLVLHDGKVKAHLANGESAVFDTVYAAMGVEYRSGLATSLGAAATDKGALTIGPHAETAIDGLYAAGDVTEGLNQIVVAMGQAAIAATAIHNRCGESQGSSET